MMIKTSCCLWIISIKVLLVSCWVLPHSLRHKTSEYFVKAPLEPRERSISPAVFENSILRKSRGVPGPVLVFITNRNLPTKIQVEQLKSQADRLGYTEDKPRYDENNLRYYDGNLRHRKADAEDELRNIEAKLALRMLPDDKIMKLEDAVFLDLESDDYPMKQQLKKDKALRDLGELREPRIYRFSDLVQ